MIIQQGDLDGLRQGTEVIILGQSAGRVTKIEYVGRGTELRMSLTLKENFKDSLYTDSIVRLRRHFGVGEPYLEIIRGPKSTEKLPLPHNGQVVRFATFEPEQDRVDQLSAQMIEVSRTIAKVEHSLVPALESINQAAVAMKSTYSDSVGPAANKIGTSSEKVAVSAQKSQERLEGTLFRFEQTADRIDQSMQVVEDRINGLTDDAKKAVNQIEKSAKQFGDGSTELKAQGVAAFKEMQNLMLDGRQMVGSIKDDVPTAVENMNDTAAGAADVVEGMKQHWLLRRYIRSSPTSTQTPPSGIRGGGG
jgi:ABC-type transporter Mla subunit MlaD